MDPRGTLGDSSGPVSTVFPSQFLLSSVLARHVVVGRQCRLPAGFYVLIEFNDTKRKTVNKPVPIHPDTVEWDVEILLPPDPAARVRFTLFASFELAPTLGNGEVLRTLDTSVGKLIEYSEREQPIPFMPDGEGIVTSCSAFVVKVDRLIGEAAKDVCINQASRSDLTHLDDGPLAQLTDQAHDALRLYHKHNEKEHLERGLELFQHALDICPRNHPCRAAALSNLAVAKLIIAQLDGTPAAFHVPILLYREALDLRGSGHPDRAATLLHLARALISRFKEASNSADADEAKDLASQVQGMCSLDTHEYRHAEFILQFCAQHEPAHDQSITRIANMLSERFEHFGDVSALHVLISLFEGALRVTPNDHSSHTFLSLVLGTSLFTRFQCLGDIADLNSSLSIIEEAVRYAPEDYPSRYTLLNTFGSMLHARFKQLGNLADLNRSISVAEETARITPDHDPDKHMCLNNYSTSLATRFQRFGNLRDLSLSIQVIQDAIRVIPDGDPNRSKYLSNLGELLRVRFGQLDNLADLNQSVMMAEEAVEGASPGYFERPSLLRNLGISLLMRFQRLNSLADLDKSIQVMEEAIPLLPEGHPDRPGTLTSLSLSLLRRFERRGDLGDLSKSVSVAEEALRLTSSDHPSRFGRLSNLGNSLQALFEHSNNIVDLERAIVVMEEAVLCIPEGHPDTQMVLGILGGSLSKRFHRVGDLGALDRAVAVLEDAVRATPERHSNRPLTLNVLGNTLRSRFERLGDTADLNKSVTAYEAALRSTLDGHPEHHVFLINLGVSLRERFERHGDPVDIVASVATLEKSVEILPDDHPARWRQLNQLANSLCSRFEKQGSLADLDKSISVTEEALRLIPNGHPSRPKLLTTLGRSLLTRAERLHNSADLTRSISSMEEAERLTPDDHPEKSMMLSNFGESIITLVGQIQYPPILQVAVSCFSRAASSSISAPFPRFRASRRWIQCAGILNHESLLDAHSQAISLLPHLAWIGLPLEERYNTLMTAADVARDAASTALARGNPELAVEWLEEGRSVVWVQLFQLRTANDELRTSHPNLANQLERLSNELDHASSRVSRDKASVSVFSIPGDGKYLHEESESMEKWAQRHRSLALEREKLLEQIRELPGFERFLQRKTFSQLRASAHSGPVVLLNASRSRCDALVILAGLEKPVHIPLPDITYEHLEILQTLLDKLRANGGRSVSCDDTVTRGAKLYRPDFAYVLSELWDKVVKPIMSVLGFSPSGKLSRIFWCPCGPFSFLPIHAAGVYSAAEPGNKVSDFVVSSYIPTLSVLSLPLERNTDSSGVRLLAVPQPSSDGQIALCGARTEIERIKTTISKSSPAPVTLLQSTGTVEDVLSMMKDSDWVHFACHGVQDGEKPTDSGLCLAAGRRLKLSDIIELSRPRGGLAFLSACQTATGDKSLSEEAVHLSAGMLFAGYSSVIGTMWAIPDSIAPDLARDVYGRLFKEGVAPDSREAAGALHDATERLRQANVPFIAWVPFIHLGI